MKAEGILDVFQTVKSLRLQRPHMVQTLVRTLVMLFPGVPGYPPQDSHILLSETREFMKLLLAIASTGVFVLSSLDIILY